jgi:hypothetical protein
MGAHLYFKLTDPEKAEQANDWLEDFPEQQRLDEMDQVQRVWFFESDEYYPGEGEGNIKTSGLPTDSKDEALECYVSLFEKLHSNPDFDVKVLGGSCSLRLSTFSAPDLDTLTNGTDALSGDHADEYRKSIKKMNDQYTGILNEFDEEVCATVDATLAEFRANDGVTMTDVDALWDTIVPLRRLDIFSPPGERQLAVERVQCAARFHRDHRLEEPFSTLFKPELRRKLLEIFLTAHTEGLTLSMVQNVIPDATEGELKAHLRLLKHEDIISTSVGTYRLRENEATTSLLEFFNRAHPALGSSGAA